MIFDRLSKEVINDNARDRSNHHCRTNIYLSEILICYIDLCRFLLNCMCILRVMNSRIAIWWTYSISCEDYLNELIFSIMVMLTSDMNHWGINAILVRDNIPMFVEIHNRWRKWVRKMNRMVFDTLHMSPHSIRNVISFAFQRSELHNWTNLCLETFVFRVLHDYVHKRAEWSRVERVSRTVPLH